MNTDLFIVGGGLSGLCLALQAKQKCPELDITVAEARKEPLQPYTAKIGESTVEVGAHYFAEVVGQRKHLNDAHLRKFGLRFFFAEGCDDLSLADEVGASNTFDVPTYQVERSSFEQHLAKTAVDLGVNLLSGTRVTDLDMGDQQHRLTLRDTERETNFCAKWVVDASGRSSLVKKKLKLDQETEHQAGSVWFRLDAKISVDDWSTDTQWRNKFGVDRRWLSTNHLLGKGYWIWIIPLAGGATSVGVVFDETIHSVENFTKMEKTLAWMRERQPLCAQAIEDCNVLDYRLLRNFAYDSSQVFSDEGWGMTGESGVFLDPFYSPGSDFIAYSNTFLTDLISRSKSGENILARSYAYQQVFQSITRSTEQLYSGQYAGFYSQRLMALKMIWDYGYYWGVLGLMFFSDSMTDMDLIRRVNTELTSVRELNNRIQQKFRVYGRENTHKAPEGLFVDQLHIPILVEFNQLLECKPGELDVGKALSENLQKITRLGAVISGLLGEGKSGTSDETELVGDLATRLVA